MKKYKLKKDFPSSKIGDIWVKADNGFMSPEGRESIKMHEHLFRPFNKWFEDYQDPKEYWCIDWTGGINHITVLEGADAYEENKKQIGNYFETKEDAEQAVEKLKAFKRLKDYYVNFHLDFVHNRIDFIYRLDGTLHSSIDEERIIFDDLKLLFGGEQ